MSEIEHNGHTWALDERNPPHVIKDGEDNGVSIQGEEALWSEVVRLRRENAIQNGGGGMDKEDREELIERLTEADEALFEAGDAVSHRASAEAALRVVEGYIDQRLAARCNNRAHNLSESQRT